MWGPRSLNAESKVSPSRVRILDHGINMPNLLQETNRFNSFQPEDLNKLRAMGITNVRIPVEIGFILPGFNAPGLKQPSTQNDCDHALTRLDAYVETFVKGGFPVTLALFMNEQYKKLNVAELRALMPQAMNALTSRYASKYNPDQLFFDVNEPYFDAAVWNAIAPALVEAIRKNAPNHTILIEPCHSETNYIAELTPLADSNIIYAMHIYYPSDFTLQGQPGKGPANPDLRFPNAKETEQKLETWMRRGIDWASSNKVPLVMNEFGCSNAADPQSRLIWVKTVRSLAEKYKIPWSYWSFSGKLFGLKPSLTSDYDPGLVEALSNAPSQASAVEHSPK